MLWLDFLNTDYHDWRGTGKDEDRLERVDMVNRLLDTWQLSAAFPLSPLELKEMRELRQWLRQLTERLVRGETLTLEDLDKLNGYMETFCVSYRLEVEVSENSGHEACPPYRLEEERQGQGWAEVQGAVAASFARMLAHNEPGRIRICDNPDCLWVFYDDTRSRTKRFCDDTMCGNLMKVRRFRAKRKPETP
ncbi:CGNR zinc finger domain-containing protein [Paenibacillus mesotrionivorans]|uniref:CGNR zinc finger domain-containing protein n=1 Tax=Paenibacillus mesotrionivorans TaxID=3160968 RepID=A0ACC7P2G8_9BACL